jgi:hypothetical protein
MKREANFRFMKPRRRVVSTPVLYLVVSCSFVGPRPPILTELSFVCFFSVSLVRLRGGVFGGLNYIAPSQYNSQLSYRVTLLSRQLIKRFKIN